MNRQMILRNKKRGIMFMLRMLFLLSIAQLRYCLEDIVSCEIKGTGKDMNILALLNNIRTNCKNTQQINFSFVNVDCAGSPLLLAYNQELRFFSTQFINCKDLNVSSTAGIYTAGLIILKSKPQNGLSILDLPYTMEKPSYNATLTAPILTISENIISDGRLLIDGTVLQFEGEDIEITASQLAIFSNSTESEINMKNVQLNAKNVNCLNSLAEATRRLHYLNFFQINFTSSSSYIEVPIPQNQIQQYLIATLQNNFTMLIVTQSNVQMSSSLIYASKLGLFATNITLDSKTLISSEGLGCPADYGLGRGVIFGSNPPLDCFPNGGHHVSYGGVGLPLTFLNQNLDGKLNKTIEQCYNLSKVAQFVSQSFPYDSYHITEGSGGGLNLDPFEIIELSNTNGSGGGLVYIGAGGNLQMDGQINCSGRKGGHPQAGDSDPKFRGGGGSGGSVKIMCTNFLGTGKIIAKGGDSSEDGLAGEGAGGIIGINLVNSDSITSSNAYFSGSFSVVKGIRNLNTSLFPTLAQFLAQDGTLETPFCPTGYQVNQETTCVPCQANQYKDSLYGTCITCPDIPQGATLDINQDNQTNCSFKCDSIICDPYGFYMSVVGPYGVIFLQVTFSILTTGYIIRRIYRLKKGQVESLPFDFEEATQDMRIADKILAVDLKISNDLVISDLLFHTHRIYVRGTNSNHSQWKLSKTPPQDVEYIINKEQYKKFAEVTFLTFIYTILLSLYYFPLSTRKRFNQAAKWKMLEKVLLVFAYCIYYPLYWRMLTRVRKNVYKRVRKFVDQNDLNVINMNVSGQFDKVKLKCSKSQDYTLCFFDILDYKTSNFKYFFLNIPYLISLSGDGSFIKPLNINTSDVFLKCLYFSLNRNFKQEIVDERQRVMENLVNHKLRNDNSNLLNKFIRKFNRYTRSIDFMAPISMLHMSFEQVVSLIHKWNQYFFLPNKVGVDLLVIESPLRSKLSETITILENNDQKTFKEFLSRISHIVHYRYDEYEIKLKLLVYNLTSPIEQIAKTMEEQRISVMTEGQLLNQSMKGSILSSDFNFLKDKLERKENLAQLQMSIHSRLSQIDDADLKIYQSGKIPNIFNKRLMRFIGFVRFLFFTHSPTNLSKHFLIFSLTTLIVVDTIFTVPTLLNFYYAWYSYGSGNNLIQDIYFSFLPYPLAVWISPVIGLLLITSQSYGIAKLYVIFNSMSIVDLFFNSLWTVCTDSRPSIIPLVRWLKVVTLFVRILILYFASKYLSTSTKLTHLNMQKRQVLY